MALAIDRKAFIKILFEGQADIGGTMLPAPAGLWSMPKEMLETIPGYGPDVEANRAEARKLMEKAGYGPNKHLQVKVSTRNIPVYRDPAVILIDQLKSIYIDADLDVVETANWFSKVARKDYALGLNLTGNAVDDPDQSFYENYSCHSERNYTNYCNPDDREAVRSAVAGDRFRQAQEAGLGDRQEAAGRCGAPDHLPRPHRHLLAALCQGRHRHGEQLLQRLSLRGCLAG